MITKALNGEPLPVYGRGLNVRDWIFVEDHAEGIWLALTKGIPGESYCFGGNSERKNIDVVNAVCDILDKRRPQSSGKSYREQLTFVEDRKGHDFRYAIDDTKAVRELGYKRQFDSFEAGLASTVDWYLENSKWLKQIQEVK
jgi:dTDP-glucose 4,6-dehydratase